MDDLRNTGGQRRRNKPLHVLALVIFGVVLNLFGAHLVSSLGLPLYLDAVGTVFAAVLGGYLPGILAGYIANLINGLTDSVNIFYGSVNAMIGVVAAFYAQKGYWKRPFKSLLTVPVLAIVGGGLGSLLTWCLFGYSVNPDNPSGKLTMFLISSGGFNEFSGQLIGDVTADLLDKAVTVLCASGLYRLVPRRWHELFLLSGWWQAPMSKEELRTVERQDLRSVSLRTKILAIITVTVMLVTVGFSFVFTLLYHNLMLEEHMILATGVTNLAVSAIDPERVDEYIELGEAAPGYLETERQLYAIRDSSVDIEYVYVYKILPDGCHVVFDLDTEDLPGAEPGELVPFDESFAEYIPDLLAGKPIEPLVTNDTYGWLLTVYAPVYDSQGNCRCYAAADISMLRVTAGEAGFMARVISLSLGVFLITLFVALWFAEYNIVLPINTMTAAAGAFAYDSEKARAASVQHFRSLDIRTGDEIENLYKAVGKTMDDTVRYVEELNTKSETITRMQNGLIMVLADMVESRDQCTGDHVQKTATYVKVIMEHMRKLGIHADEITDKFFEDVVASAPLHDVGKIHVSDAILNKPGRLTDEEFAIMKTHTTAGREIIDMTIKVVGGESGYLGEARHLSSCHHERWDGKGYPDGLKGEDIPLSARIMAVADVFDALVSRRVYKAPFSFEAAMDIIREGSGTQFDPEVVRAFVDAEDEVRAISETFIDK